MVRAGDNPMQKLAMMMAVMILGMSPAHAYSINVDPGSLEVGGLVEMMPPLARVYNDEWTLQQAQLEIEDLERTRNRILRSGQVEAEEAPGEPRERNQVYRLEGEATPKTTEALRRGADAARGRGRLHQEMEERN